MEKTQRKPADSSLHKASTLAIFISISATLAILSILIASCIIARGWYYFEATHELKLAHKFSSKPTEILTNKYASLLSPPQIRNIRQAEDILELVEMGEIKRAERLLKDSPGFSQEHIEAISTSCKKLEKNALQAKELTQKRSIKESRVSELKNRLSSISSELERLEKDSKASETALQHLKSKKMTATLQQESLLRSTTMLEAEEEEIAKYSSSLREVIASSCHKQVELELASESKTLAVRAYEIYRKQMAMILG